MYYYSPHLAHLYRSVVWSNLMVQQRELFLLNPDYSG